jgi:hypothetical protein
MNSLLRALLLTTVLLVMSLSSTEGRPMEQGTEEWWYATIMSEALDLIDFDCDPAWLEYMNIDINVVCRLTFDSFPQFRERWKANMIFGVPKDNWQAVTPGRFFRNYHYETPDGQPYLFTIMWDSSGLVMLMGAPYP